MSNVAGQGTYSVKGLKEQGQQANLVIWRNNSYGYDYDLSLNIGKNKLIYPWYALKICGYAFYAMFHYDYFHFHFGYSLLPFNFDLRILKKLNKKFVMEYHGSDIRFKLSNDRGEGFQEYQIPEKANLIEQKNIARVFKYSDIIILHDSELYKYLIGYNHKVVYVPLRVDLSKTKPMYPNINVKRPIIVHAPTNIETKGSQYVFDAIERLKNKYNFEFVLVQNKTQEEALAIYQTADIIVDQLRVGTYGVFAVEAMAMGKPVISYVTDNIKKEFPEELPIVSASIYNIQEQLEVLLNSGELRNKLGKAGRKYAETYHDYQYCDRLLSEIYAGEYQETNQLRSFLRVKEIKESLDGL